VLEDSTSGIDSVSFVALEDVGDSAGDGIFIRIITALLDGLSNAISVSHSVNTLSVLVAEEGKRVDALLGWGSRSLANLRSENSAGWFHLLKDSNSDRRASSLDFCACSDDILETSLVAFLESLLGVCLSAVADSLCI